MSAAELDTLYAAYAAARGSGDYDSAIGYLLDMQARLATTPDLQEGAGGQGIGSVRWRDADLTKLIAECRRLKAEALAATGLFQRTNVVYARATDSGDYS